MTAPENAGVQQALEARLMELEIKASFMDDVLDKLDQVVIRQQQQIDFLQRELLALHSQNQASDPATQRNLRDELPPHY